MISLKSIRSNNLAQPYPPLSAKIPFIFLSANIQFISFALISSVPDKNPCSDRQLSPTITFNPNLFNEPIYSSIKLLSDGLAGDIIATLSPFCNALGLIILIILI